MRPKMCWTVLLVLGLASTALAAPVRYKAIDIGRLIPETTWLDAIALSETGIIIGEYGNRDIDRGHFIYHSHSSGAVKISNSSSDFVGGAQIDAVDVDDAGQVAFYHRSAGGGPYFEETLLRRTDGSFVRLGAASERTEPWAMSRSGEVVGTIRSHSPNHAYLWNVPEGFQMLPGLANRHSYATDINDNGLILGMYYGGTGDNIFLYDTQTNEVRDVDFDEPEGCLKRPVALNNQDQFVMRRDCGVGISSFFWSAETDFLIMPEVDGRPTTYNWVKDVNDAGYAVGRSERTGPYVWHQSFGAVNLREALVNPMDAGDMLWAVDINNAGQILVDGVYGSTYLLTPVPEPSSLALLNLSVIGAYLLWRRK